MGVLKDVNPHFLFRLQALACLSAHTRVRPSARATTKQVGRLISFLGLGRLWQGEAVPGKARYGLVGRCAARRGTAWWGQAWCGWARNHRCTAATNCRARRGAVRCGWVWRGTARPGEAGPDEVRSGEAWSGEVRRGEARQGIAARQRATNCKVSQVAARHGEVRRGRARLCEAKRCEVRRGPA